MTFNQFRETWEHSGESVMALAYAAMDLVNDDELRDAGKAAIEAEDRFEVLLSQRGVERG